MAPQINVTTTVGIEYDIESIRAVKVSAHSDKKMYMEAAEELVGDYSTDTSLIEGLAEMKRNMGIGRNDRIVTCVSGKQLFVSQISFRLLPPSEMKTALQFELRKNLPFEVTGSALDYLVVGEIDGQTQVLVAVVAGALLENHLRCFETAGLRPEVVDAVPLAIANTVLSTGSQKSSEIRILLHIGPEISTLVIDGAESPLYHRNIYFNASELAGPGNQSLSASDIEKRLTSLVDEVVRTITYYQTTFKTSGVPVIILLGPYAPMPDLGRMIRSKTSLTTCVGIAIPKLESKKKPAPGKFEVAAVLATRQE